MSMEKKRRCKLWQRVDFPAVNRRYDVFRFQSSFVGRASRDDIGYYYAFDGRPEAEGTQLLGAARIGSGELTSRMLK